MKAVILNPKLDYKNYVYFYIVLYNRFGSHERSLGHDISMLHRPASVVRPLRTLPLPPGVLGDELRPSPRLQRPLRASGGPPAPHIPAAGATVPICEKVVVGRLRLAVRGM